MAGRVLPVAAIVYSFSWTSQVESIHPGPGMDINLQYQHRLGNESYRIGAGFYK